MTTSNSSNENANENENGNENGNENENVSSLFHDFTSFLIKRQGEIIQQIEEIDASGETFCRDAWGVFNNNEEGQDYRKKGSSGGITRVIQGGAIVEKGACSLTLLQGKTLSKERAAAIRGRQQHQSAIQEGDEYSAAALSMVLHTRSPLIPTFRSDVRIFMVQPQNSTSNQHVVAWFGGGADLTPYYLFDEDIAMFHDQMKQLCVNHNNSGDDDIDNHSDSTIDNHSDNHSDSTIDYPTMKQACDDYFYLPARSEHRGVGGIFFDDMPSSEQTLSFVSDVVDSWMPSWFPIIEKRRHLEYTSQQRQWQLLRRGRYLEFNLLYDRGVKFGLANANPRVEGVMVSAPPLIAWEYNHDVEEGSEEARLMDILKQPIDWV
jgi:coproporphyrinogen III oxidase